MGFSYGKVLADQVFSTAIGPSNVLSFGVWHESFGDMVLEQTVCIYSPDAAGDDFELDIRTGASFELDHEGSSNDEIDIEFQYRNLLTGSAYETLKNKVFGKEENTFQSVGCPNGHNVGLKVIIRSNDVATADDGVYSADFILRARRNGNAEVKEDFTVEIEKLPGLRVGNLVGYQFNWSGVQGSLTQIQPFCIYSDNAYRIDFESGNSNGNGQFFLKSILGDTLPYIVSFRNQENYVNFQRARNLEGFNNLTSNAADPHCSTGGNAELRIWINSARMEENLPGNYSDTLTIRVSPSD